MFGRPPTHLQIEVPLSPERVEERLRSSMKIVRSLLLSPAWGAVEPFVGRVGPGFFEMRVRHGYSNGLTRLLYARVRPTPRGTRIEARFTSLGWVLLILRLIWVALLGGIGLYLLELGGHSDRGSDMRLVEVALGLSVSAATLGALLAVEVIGRRLGDRDEERMRLHLGNLFKE